jgi:hypothetical protein
MEYAAPVLLYLRDCEGAVAEVVALVDGREVVRKLTAAQLADVIRQGAELLRKAV